ncbi:MAG: hypothetical protein ACLRRN_02510 [Oscillospiraceae bacterium]
MGPVAPQRRAAPAAAVRREHARRLYRHGRGAQRGHLLRAQYSGAGGRAHAGGYRLQSRPRRRHRAAQRLRLRHHGRLLRRRRHREHHRYLTDDRGRVTKLITSAAAGAGVASMEIYIVNKDVLLGILDFCAQENRFHFHRDGLFEYLGRGGTMDVFLHRGYAVRVDTVADYFAASMDMLEPLARASLFPADRPVRTKERADVSTYYGEHAHVENCLVADGCFIEGTVTDCILFRGVRVARGAHLSRCIVMQDTCIAADAILQYVIADKNVRIGPAVTLTGCEALPIVIPKGSEL